MAEPCRPLASLVAVLLACASVSTLQERSLDPAAGLEEFVHAERRALLLPGLAAVVVRSDGTPRVYVSGERRIGKGDLITTADRMHLGSLTKAITATLVGALAEKGLMTLDTTIGQTFPELSPKMQPAYRQVTVRQLLRHSAGIATYGTNVSLLPMLGLKGTPTEQRYAFLQRVLAEPPRFDPGSRFEYSNAGAAIVGAMAERIAGSPYRELVERLVFAPIGARVAFGNPGLAGEPQPWGHRRILGAVVEVPPAAPLYTIPLAIEPAGDASPSLPDCARFLQLHLRGLKGQDDGLKARTIQVLQGRSPDGTPRGGAVGWNVMPRDGVESHEHFGSSGAYVAYATIQPSRDVAVGVFTNLGGGQELRDAVARVALRIAARYSADKVESKRQ
ncbi:MAG TPA: serine hydrolase domain-containing protein [Vicinamibacterales bacterium]|jgi:CubicO group peptidase (beta-lactamase class C family)|nr:serine hydrolase domain-containing protein [Vicinamibacterales bacterium]